MNFIEFMEQLVIPAKKANPDHIRLDGKLKEPNGSMFGKFQHFERTWRVNYDTHYLPLQLAYDAAMDGKNPFLEGLTNRKHNPKLKLQPEIRKLQRKLQIERQMDDYDYLNIYLIFE